MYIPECTSGCIAVEQDDNRIWAMIKFSSRTDRDLLISSGAIINHALLTEIIDIPKKLQRENLIKVLSHDSFLFSYFLMKSA